MFAKENYKYYNTSRSKIHYRLNHLLIFHCEKILVTLERSSRIAKFFKLFTAYCKLQCRPKKFHLVGEKSLFPTKKQNKKKVKL